MNDRDNFLIGVFSFILVVIFLGYGVMQSTSDVLAFNTVQTSTLSIGGISEVVGILNDIKDSVQNQQASIEIFTTESEEAFLVEGLMVGDYDAIVIANPITGQQEVEGFLFGVLNQEAEQYEDNLIYVYALNHQLNKDALSVYLNHYYEQPLAFVNTESVFALQNYIYEETLAYLRLLQGESVSE